MNKKVSGIKSRKTKFIEGPKLKNYKTKYVEKNPKILHLLTYISSPSSLTQPSSTLIKI